MYGTWFNQRFGFRTSLAVKSKLVRKVYILVGLFFKENLKIVQCVRFKDRAIF